MDVLALQETWISENGSDDFYIKSLNVPGYDLFNVPRSGGDAHGGIAILYRKNMTVVSKTINRNISSFESCEIVFSMGPKCLTLFVVYRPHPSRLFFEEFAEVVQDLAMAKGDLLVVGDLNVHVDVSEDPETRQLVDTSLLALSNMLLDRLTIVFTHWMLPYHAKQIRL